MEFSIATLLANFTDDKLVAAKVLERKLGCFDETSLKKLQIALDVLQKIGILVKERGKYRRVPEESVIEAKLRCSSKGFCFAIQDVEAAEDIYIRESHLSTAWNGDRVLVKLTKEGSRRRSPEGEVRLILERSNQTLLGRIKQTSNGFRAVPLDDRLLFELELEPTTEIDLAQAIDHLAHVEIIRYPLGQYPPIGRVVQILGSDAEAAADIDLVCCKHDMVRNFSPSVLEAAASLSEQPVAIDVKQRLDLRHLLTIAFAASSPCSVVENAFTLEKTAQNNWRLGVHIADVAHYVQSESLLDRESSKRGSSVYLGETVLPLLPEVLQQQCSLLPGIDRLAISIFITLDANTGQLIEFEIQPTVINVDQQLDEQILVSSLSETASLIELSELELPMPVRESLSQLLALAQAVRAQRHERGSFELRLPTASSHYLNEGVLGWIVEPPTTVRSLLIELVILANQTLANYFKQLDLPAIYRVQPAPDAEDVQEMIKLASNLGVELRLEQEDKVKPSDFKRFTEQFAQLPDAEQVLTYQLRDTLKPAVYSTTFAAHFGLAVEQGYTHCNSPLQRYPDLLNQRVLHLVFEQGRDRRTTRAKEGVNLRHSSCLGQVNWNVLPPEEQQELESDFNRIIVSINEREKEVQEAQADLAGLQKAQVMKEMIGEVFDGLITGVQSYGFFVEIEVPAPDGRLLRVEGLVHVSSLKDDWYEYRARQQALFGRKNRAAYRLGNRVPVQVKSVDYYRQQIDLVAVNGERQPVNEDLYSLENDQELGLDLEVYSDEE